MIPIGPEYQLIAAFIGILIVCECAVVMLRNSK